MNVVLREPAAVSWGAQDAAARADAGEDGRPGAEPTSAAPSGVAWAEQPGAPKEFNSAWVTAVDERDAAGVE